MTFFRLLLATLTACGIAAVATVAAAAASRPNIILIMTDDQGYGDLSIHGNPVLETPHLDAFAHARAAAVTAAHMRVRERGKPVPSGARDQQSSLDVLGIYVLLPAR